MRKHLKLEVDTEVEHSILPRGYLRQIWLYFLNIAQTLDRVSSSQHRDNE